MSSSYRIAIVEDSVADLAALRSALERYAVARSAALSIAHFVSVEALLAHYAGNYDLIFFDIELPGANGMEGARRIRRTDGQVGIIFVTNLARFAIEGYQADALDYVLKPVVYERFAIKLDRALSRLGRDRGRYVLIKSLEGSQKLDTRDIVYVKVMMHTLRYHLTCSDDAAVSGNLGSLEKELAADGFARCKSCYLVNLRHVSRIRGDEAVMSNGSALKISRGIAERFREAFMRYVAGGCDIS